MFRRKIEGVMLAWKKNPHRKPLVIKGCRQCGKTSSVLAFAKDQDENVVYLNFHEHKEYKSFFSGALDVDTVLLNISMGLKGVNFVDGNTCIVFDEIQDCPNARSSLKFFCLDGRYDVICTGSLLGVNGYKTKEEDEEERRASIPVGYEHIVTMYPMDFEEWLWANGLEQQHIDYLAACFHDETPVMEGIHNRMRELLRLYIVVGGMPEAINTFFATNNMNDVRDVQQNIVDNYKSDMLKYALQEDKSKIRECFDSIPSQLAKENKKFQFNKISKNARSREYTGCIEWLIDAGVIVECNCLLFPELPLKGNADESKYKLYYPDTGLLVSALDEEAQADEVMKLGPWNPYMMEIWPAQMSAIILGMKKGPNLGPSVAPVFVQLPTSSSKVFMPPMPTPYTTPMRFLSAVSRSMPQSLMPWMAPASAYWQ